MKKELIVSEKTKDIIQESKNLISQLNQLLPKNKKLPTNEKKDIILHVSSTPYYSGKISSCSKYLAYTFSYHNKIALFDLSTNKEIYVFDIFSRKSCTPSMAFSPDEKYFIAINGSGSLFIWSILELRLVTTIDVDNDWWDTNWGGYITFSNNLQYIIIGNRTFSKYQSAIKIIDFKTILEDDKYLNQNKIYTNNNLVSLSKKKYFLNGFKTNIDATELIIITNDNRYLITTCEAYTIRVWDIKKREEVCTLNRNNIYMGYDNCNSDIRTVGLFEVSNNIVVAGYSNGKVIFWNIIKKKKILSYKIDCYKLNSIVLSPDKQYIIANLISDNAVISIFKTKYNENIGAFSYEDLGIIYWFTTDDSVTFTSSGYILVSPYKKSQIKKLLKLNKDGKSMKLVCNLNSIVNICHNISITSDNKYIIVLNNRISTSGESIIKKIELIDIETGEIINSFKCYGHIISSVFLYNGIDCIVTQDYGKDIIVWDLFNAKKIQTFTLEKNKQYSAYISKNGQYIAVSADNSNKNYILEIKSGKKIQKINSNITYMKFINNDKNIIFIANYKINIWDIGNRQIVKTITVKDSQIIVYYNNKYFITSSTSDGIIQLYDIQDEKILKTFKGHLENLKFTYITKNEKILITMSCDDNMRFWDIDKEKEILSKRLNYTYERDSIIVTSDEKYIIGKIIDGAIKIFDIGKNKIVSTHINYTDGSWVYHNVDGYYNTNNIDRVTFIEKRNKSFQVLNDSNQIYELRKIKKVLDY